MKSKTLLLLAIVSLLLCVVGYAVVSQNSVVSDKGPLEKPLESKESDGPSPFPTTLTEKDAPSEVILASVETAILATDFTKAESLLQELLAKEPSNSAARYGLAQSKAQQGEILGAVEELHEALTLRPELITKAIEDPLLQPLRNETNFHDLLRIQGIEIPEMYRQPLTPPVAFSGEQPEEEERATPDTTRDQP